METMFLMQVDMQPSTRPYFETILLGRTSLEFRNANTFTYPRLFYSRCTQLNTKMACTQEKPKDKYVDHKLMRTIPEYAILEAIREDKYEQPIFETLDYYYVMGDNDFPNRVRKINKEEKMVSEENLEYYLSFWGET